MPTAFQILFACDHEVSLPVDRNKSFCERIRIHTDEAFFLFYRGHFAIAACIAAG
jgi:hypothetical protein